MEIIRELCSFEGRLAGTDAERRAANRLAERLRKLGRRVEVEPIYVHPQLGLIYAAHCVLGVAGSLVAVAVPVLGLRARARRRRPRCTCDLNARFYLLRRLFFRRASQNVVSRGRPRRRARAADRSSPTSTPARTGAVYSPKRIRRFSPARERASRSRSARPGCCSGRSPSSSRCSPPARPGLDSNVISILQLPSTPRPADRRVRVRRHRALRRRPRRQRQRLRRRDRARRSPTSSRPSRPGTSTSGSSSPAARSA